MRNKKQAREFEPNWLESRLCLILGNLLMRPYNWSLILLTALIWGFGGCLFSYSANANFDMLRTVSEYFRDISILLIAVGLFFKARRAHYVVGLGIINYLLSVMSIIMSKTLFLNGLMGICIFYPLNIFCILLAIKNVWIMALDKAINASFEE